MGKKSIEEYPYMYDGGDRTSATGFMDGDKSVEGSQQWKDALLSLLKMMESSDNRNSQSMRDTRLSNRKFWESEDNNNNNNKEVSARLIPDVVPLIYQPMYRRGSRH